jgi:nucleotide-binding universal stress UspA family protein
MAIQKLLLPYNFTRFDQKALDFVISAFAKLKNIEVTLFNAYTAVPEIETASTSVTSKLKESLSYLSQKITAIKQKLIEGGFEDGFVHTIFQPRKKEVANEIIDLATANHFDVIVMSHRPGRATRFFTGSRYNKVIAALRNVTVCIVS